MTAKGIRPYDFSQFIGQTEAVQRLEIMVSAALAEDRTVDHILLTGPPGLGKTTLAGIISNAMGSRLRVITAPALPKPADLAEALIELKAKDCLFIDEIHRLTPEVEESLYPAIEDGEIDASLKLGDEEWKGRVTLEPFTLIGATTRAGGLSAPLRDRFGEIIRLKLYPPEELALIVKRSAGILGISIEPEAVLLIALRSRGTPRIANRLLARAKDYALYRGASAIDRATAKEALTLYGTDALGLDEGSRALLEALAEEPKPVGVNTLALLVNEDAVTVETVIEPYLMRAGLIRRSARGREITKAGRAHLESLPAEQRGEQI